MGLSRASLDDLEELLLLCLSGLRGLVLLRVPGLHVHPVFYSSCVCGDSSASSRRGIGRTRVGGGKLGKKEHWVGAAVELWAAGLRQGEDEGEL